MPARQGIPPPTLASKRNSTLFSLAVFKNSSKYFAITALFALTTDFYFVRLS